MAESEEVSFYDAYSAYQSFCKSPSNGDVDNRRMSAWHFNEVNAGDVCFKNGPSSRIISKKYFESYIYGAFENDNVQNGKIRL